MKTRAGCVFCALLFWASSAQGADVDTLVKDLKAKDPDLRRTAARELGKMGAEAKPAVDALAKALKDDDTFVRRFAALALGEIGADAKGAVPALAAALRDREKRVVEAAATALGSMGSEGVKPLAALVKDPSKEPALRARAAESLGKIGPAAKSAVPVLVEVLQNKSKDKKKKNMPVDGSLRLEVVQALGSIGPEAKEAQPVLEEIAANRRERDRVFKRAVTEALRKIKK
jgi:HEAT repeat protein